MWTITTPYADKTLTTFGCETKGYGDQTGLIASENWAASIKVRKPKEWKTPAGWDTGEGSHGSIHRNGRTKPEDKKTVEMGKDGTGFKGHSGNYKPDGTLIGTGKANKRSVWTVPPMAFKEAHFATYPPDLIVDCIKAGCPEGGTVLDPFMGAATTALVSRKLNLNYIGIELNKEYIEKIAKPRLARELGLFL